MTTRDNTISAEMAHAEYLALCPLDGRYAAIGQKLSPYFSEYALIENRVKVEVYWLKFLLENIREESDILKAAFDEHRLPEIMTIYENFSIESCKRVKEIEKVTKHDVKAVELYVGEQLKKMGLENLVSFVHIGCTSEDITNAAYANMIAEALENVLLPAADKLIATLYEMAYKYRDIPMLAHTHGQPATPTTVGKELAVYEYRLRNEMVDIQNTEIFAKFNGATGNYAAISVAFPNQNWQELSIKFVEEYLGLIFNPMTTQIESHDYMCHLFNDMCQFSRILRNLDTDMWQYISMGYFKQLVVGTEVGSSTMPHKVNPINFENSESNTYMVEGVFSALVAKLSRSRMQRDLSDSSAQRNIGLGFGYLLQAIEQTIAGLNKVAVNEEKISADLDSNWEVLAEPIQTMLRKYGVTDAYDQLKKMTRGKKISEEDMQKFIESLDMISEDDRESLLSLNPWNYTGLASEIVEYVM